ncbi:MAG: hypothetical protein AB1508_03025 [Pseudomonadota bacterium]
MEFVCGPSGPRAGCKSAYWFFAKSRSKYPESITFTISDQLNSGLSGGLIQNRRDLGAQVAIHKSPSDCDGQKTTLSSKNKPVCTTPMPLDRGRRGD